MSKSLIEEFNVKVNKQKPYIVNDYDIFPDKNLLDELRNKIIGNLIDKEIPKEKINEFIDEEINLALEGHNLTNLERSHIYNLIDNEINGFGPLNEILKDNNVTEIMVNSPKEIYIETDGKLVRDESISFINNEHIIRTIQRLISPMGKTINTKNPIVDSRLMDGSRINAVIPPLSIKGPVLTIRKFKPYLNTIDDLIRSGSLTPYMARFLEAAVIGKLNIIICGGSGSGKTTLLNILSSFINDNERIITIEDAAELKLKQKHVLSLETRPNNYENEGEITIRDLVINSLRMRPDRIIVGEVRGKEAFDMMQAMNTGHDGSITTLHANSPKDALNRLETMVMMSDMGLPLNAVKEYIYNAIDLVINVERLSDGRRKITSICEVDKIEDNEIKLKEIFAFKINGLSSKNMVTGEYILYKFIPKVFYKLKKRGITSLSDIFEK